MCIRDSLEIAAQEDFQFVSVDHLGQVIAGENLLEKHIEACVNYPLVDKAAIEAANFSIVIDAINSTCLLYTSRCV